MLGFLHQLSQTTLAFFAILLFTRLIGKQQISQLTYYDYINGITIGSIAGTIATDTGEKMWGHLLDLSIFCILTIIISIVVLKNRPLRKLLDGEPTIVIHNGKILENNMRKMRYNMDDLLMQLRQKNVFNTQDVEFAVMEPNGMLSILLKSQKRPLTPADNNMATQYEGMESAVVIDGEIIHKNLQQLNLDQNWLLQELKKQGITDLHQVNYVAIDTQGKLYFDSHNDQVHDKPVG